LEGFTEQEAMFEQLRDSHIALMPSIHEGFGLVGWEAICAGIPLICSDQSGLADFLESCFDTNHDLPRESVLMLRLAGSDEDVATLSAKIQELTRTYERRRSHARSLADYLAERFSWDECARSVASAIDLAPLGSPLTFLRGAEGALDDRLGAAGSPKDSSAKRCRNVSDRSE
jgi:glycosyltransferase involved in cell wall biosynthesis